MKRHGLLRVLGVAAIAAAALASWGNTAHAAGGPESQGGAIITTAGNSGQDPEFVALKKAFRVHSGVARGQAKGTPSHSFISATPMSLASTASTVYTWSWGYCYSCAEVTMNNWVPNSWEPGAGTDQYGYTQPNFGYGTPNYDDTKQPYKDQNFYDLCGPGAADVALQYWPAPNNLWNYTATDPYNYTTTTWDGSDPYDQVGRARGYMVNLAWKINPGNQGGALGMMQGGTGTKDTRMRDALNWEASGENTSNWQNYFYVLASNSLGYNLHSDVQADISNSNVPVVLLVNAHYLPNWPSTSQNPTWHYITIVGYNDNTQQYAYTDTCGNSTACGSKNDGGINVASQSTVASATSEWFW